MSSLHSRWDAGGCNDHSRRLNAQRGASLVEFSIVGLSIVLVGMFTLQLGLIYHAKTTLNYAVFEAARAGAVNNASMSAIREELGYRLAPLQGGDGSRKRAMAAVARSALNMKDPLATNVVILNPTKAAFKDWSIKDPVSGERIIPVNHLRHQTYAIGTQSGLSLRDANLLKLQVTHGVDLRVPVVGKLMTGPMKWIDTKNAAYYLRGKWPIQAVAMVRMQSDSFESEILKSASNSTNLDSGTGDDRRGGTDGNAPVSATTDSTNAAQTDDDDFDPAQVNGHSVDEQNEGIAHNSENGEPDNRDEHVPVDNGGENDTRPSDAASTATDTDTDVATNDVATDRVSEQTSPVASIYCDENTLLGNSSANLIESKNENPGLISTRRFREILAQRDVPESRQ